MRHLYLTLMAVCCITIAGMAADVTKKLVQFATPIDKPVSSELVAVGPDNSMYMVGQFNVEFDFAGKTLTPIDAGSTYILKYNADGEPVWGASVKGAISPVGVVFVGDNLVIAANIKGDQEINPAKGDVQNVTLTSYLERHSLLFSFDTEGSLVWHKLIEGNPSGMLDEGLLLNTIVAGSNDKVLVAGSFDCSITLGNNTFTSKYQDLGGGFTLSSGAAFYAAVDRTTGDFTSAGAIYAAAEGQSNVKGSAIANDSEGNIYFSCFGTGAWESVDGSKTWDVPLYLSNPQHGFLVAKVDAAGEMLWDNLYVVSNSGVDATNQPDGLVSHISVLENGKLALSGNFENELVLTDNIKLTSAGKSDFFIAQASADAGLVDFAHRFGNSAANSGLVAFSKANKLYMAGEFARTFDFTESQSLTSNYDTTDVFLASYDFATSTWTANSFGGDSLEFVSGIALTSQGNMVATGIFKATDAAKANMFGTQVTSSLVEGNYVYDSYLLVTGENHAPVATGTIDNATVRAREVLSIAIPENLFSDADADNLTITVTLKDGSNLPQWLVFNAETSTISGTPARENMGTIEVTVAATDPYSLSASVTFSVTVEAPTGIDDNLLADFRVYPTYASTHINLENVVRAKLFSVAGIMVKEVAGQNSISVAGLSSGVYLLHVEAKTGSKRVVRVFVK